MSVTRRDLLRFAGAATAGLIVSPLPWKLLDDVAIWTQTGPWIPKLPRGPVTQVPTVCAVCPAGCPVTARCVAGVPSVLRASAGSGRSLCPIGLTGHHLAYHPLRLAGPCIVERRGEQVVTTPLSLDEALRRLPVARSNAAAGRTMMIVDQRPGRAVSDRYRAFLRERAGIYAVIGNDGDVPPIGFDLERARTILAVCAPLLDGWTTPARTARLVERRSVDDGLRIIAADAARTRTAMLADRWMPIQPGSESLLLAALLYLLDRRRHQDLPPSVRELVDRCDPSTVAAAIGCTPDHVRHVAEKLTDRGPSVVIVGNDGSLSGDRDAHRLAEYVNRALEARRHGTLTVRPGRPLSEGLRERDLADVTPLPAVPDASVDLVILDGEEGTGHLSWESVARTLRPHGALVVSLSPVLTALASHADLILPSPAPYETTAEATGDPTDPSTHYAISRPLHPRRPGSVDAMTVLAHLSGRPMSHEDALRSKVSGLFAARRGLVRSADGSVTPLSSVDSAETLWSTLMDGGAWTHTALPSVEPRTVASEDDPEFAKRITQRLSDLSARRPAGFVTVVPTAWAPVTSSARLSPLMTKLYQESGLRPTAEVAAVAPETAAAFGVSDGASAELRSGEQASAVTVRVSDSLAPGMVQVSSGPDPVGLRSPASPTAAIALPLGRAAELRKT